MYVALLGRHGLLKKLAFVVNGENDGWILSR